MKLAAVIGVKTEAERRIDAGTLINGVQFKCNEPSVNRVHGMLTAAREAEAGGGTFKQTFMTDAGDTVTVDGAAEALVIFKAASGYVGAVLSASATLQGQVSSMTAAKLKDFNATDPANWP